MEALHASEARFRAIIEDQEEFISRFTPDFTLIFVARNSLLHLLSTADLVAAFTSVRRHLAADGVFAFDIFNPNVTLLSRPRGERFPVMEVDTAAFGPLRVESANDYDSATQVNRATWYISTPEKRDAWIVPLALRSIFPQELPAMLSAAGLELISRFGELSREPIDIDVLFSLIQDHKSPTLKSATKRPQKL